MKVVGAGLARPKRPGWTARAISGRVTWVRLEGLRYDG